MSILTQTIKAKQRGSIFILSIIFALVVAVAVISLVTLQINYHKITQTNLDRISALYNAESGIQLVLHELRHKAVANRFLSSNGWTILGNKYTITKDGITYAIEITGLT